VLCRSNELTTLGLELHVLLYMIVKNLGTKKSGIGKPTNLNAAADPSAKEKKWAKREKVILQKKFKLAFWNHISFASGSSSPFLWLEYNMFG
jgi:hypothetical protein